MAALLGALPLALGFGDGAELRRPLGISIVGGLIVSQVLTLYTTPVVYLYLDRFRRRDRDRPQPRWRAPWAAPGGRAGDDGIVAPFRCLRRVAAAVGCLVGPDYERPPPARRRRPSSRRPATAQLPARHAARRDRSRQVVDLYGDPALDQLAAQVDVSNQNLKVAEAAYRQAVALIRQSQSALYPTIGYTGSVDAEQLGRQPQRRQHLDLDRRQSVGQYALGGTLTWEIDLWGRIRRTIESDSAAAQASAADLDVARLSAQVEPGHQLFLAAHLRRSAAAARGNGGRLRAARCRSCRTSSMPASPRASTSPRRRPSSSRRARSSSPRASTARQFEHAIAVLIGKPPAEFSLRARRRCRRRCRPSTPACRRRCSSGGPTSPRPSARWRRPTPRSASRWRPTIPTSRSNAQHQLRAARMLADLLSARQRGLVGRAAARRHR